MSALVQEKLRQIQATIRADVQRSRLVLGALLGDRRFRVYRDGPDYLHQLREDTRRSMGGQAALT